VAYATARADLLELAEQKLLTKIKRGRAIIYEAAPDLSTRLKKLK
jgi:DeoR/GlpR family transcriptional regulator of sugar metabolism